MKFRLADIHHNGEKLYRLPEGDLNPATEAQQKMIDDHGEVIIGSRKDLPNVKPSYERPISLQR